MTSCSCGDIEERSALAEIANIMRGKRKRAKISEKVVGDARSFQLGQKPGGWLVDLCQLDHRAVNSLLEYFKRGEGENSAKALELQHRTGNDLVFYRMWDNWEIVRRKVTFIDITARLDEPRVIACEDVFDNLADLDRMMGQLEESCAQTLICKDSWNVSTLFGLFLKYPVIYWYESEENCLSNQDLIVVKIRHKATSRIVSQFSYPASLRYEVENGVQSWFEANFNVKKFEMICDIVNQTYYAL